MSKTIRLDSLLEQAAQDDCRIGWVYTPKKAYFIRRSDGSGAPWLRLEPSASGYHEAEEDFSAAYEVILFSPNNQYHWTNTTNGEGTYGQLCEASATFQDVDLYLWGEITPEESLVGLPWTKLSSARTGDLFVPTDVDQSHRYVTLKQRNFLDEDNYGNVYIKSSRYIGFTSTNGTTV